MAVLTVGSTQQLHGEVNVPGDKSISHRAVMLAALARGRSKIMNFLMSDDCLRTAACIRNMGIDIELDHDTVWVAGKGLDGLSEPEDVLYAGNSGTTIRLLSGILAGQEFTSVITGDASLRRRPMGRITKPLQLMGARIIGRQSGSLAPLAIEGGSLRPITYRTPTASAQVKSAVLLAGLFCEGWTEVIEPARSRDHTELMLKAFGVPVEVEGLSVRVKGRHEFKACELAVPGDLSSAAFLMVAACMVPDARVVIRSVGLNPTRSGIIDILKSMGARIAVVNLRESMGEPVGDVIVESSRLSGTAISGELVVRAIDEIPVVAVAAAAAEGTTEIRDAEELKVKESNRIAAVAGELGKMGAAVHELPDGLRIVGGKPLMGAEVDSHHDHRIALALAVMGLAAKGKTRIMGAECLAVSYPAFPEALARLGGEGIEYIQGP
ncbi:MAG: 3-phosphoshikimate 1-carboxyvinyltransferase [Firmicutes bacterium]|nr:3-phosphoshikimate 1-carboxyvinyltransferase [Bacillota bacterium]NLL87977.1 3-phosphoshikimate 1-carboxyvinyltransferase [Bacillota bacterium]